MELARLPPVAIDGDGEDELEFADVMHRKPPQVGGVSRRRGILCCTLLSGLTIGSSATLMRVDGYRTVRPEQTYEIPPLSSMACPNLSPTWPSKGGPDCPLPCPENTSSFGTAFWGVFPEDFVAATAQAARYVESVDLANTISLNGFVSNAAMESHISFSYHCCYTAEEKGRMKAVVETWEGWTPHQVKFGDITCAVDGPSPDHVSLIIMLDEESNRLMMQWVGSLEQALRDAGLRVRVPRRDQEPFHTTLAVVNGSGYPVKQALQELHARHAPGSWSREPVELVKPCSAHDDTPEGFFC